MTAAKLADGVPIEDVIASAREGLRDDWEWRHEVVSDVIVRLADELAATKARTSEARDCGQVGVCKIAPGCQRHWEERNRELVQRNVKLVALLEGHSNCNDYYSGEAFRTEASALLAEIKGGG